MINQAVRITTVEHGEPEFWVYADGVELSSGKTPKINYKNNLDFVNKYFSPYIRFLSCENWSLGGDTRNNAAVMCHFATGDAMVIGVYHGGSGMSISVDIYYVIDFRKASITRGNRLTDTRHVYYFSLQKENDDASEEDHTRNKTIRNKNFVVPYALNWDGDESGLTRRGTKYSCSSGYTQYPAYCTKLLELNNWKFPDNYPW